MSDTELLNFTFDYNVDYYKNNIPGQKYLSGNFSKGVLSL